MGGRGVASLKLTGSLTPENWLVGRQSFFFSWGLAHFSGAVAVSSREGKISP